MSCLSSTPTLLAVPELKHADRHSDAESTVAGEHSDIETVEESCPSEVPSPRSSGTADVCEDEEGPCNVVVRSTFIDVDDGRSLMQRVPSPRSSGTADVCEDEEGPCNVVVRSTFIDVDDGRSLMQRYRQLRRAKTDSLLMGAFADEEPYYPGRFSDERAEAPEAVNAPSAPAAPAAPAEPAPQPAAGTGRDAKNASAERTTLMLRNVPNNYSRDMFLAMLDEHGFARSFPVVCQAHVERYRNSPVMHRSVPDEYKPVIFKNGVRKKFPRPTKKGFKAHVERYRNSPVMHRSVPDEYKPVIFKNGVRKNFPRPTKKELQEMMVRLRARGLGWVVDASPGLTRVDQQKCSYPALDAPPAFCGQAASDGLYII
eukprot:s1688_g4.t1